MQNLGSLIVDWIDLRRTALYELSESTNIPRTRGGIEEATEAFVLNFPARLMHRKGERPLVKVLMEATV